MTTGIDRRHLKKLLREPAEAILALLDPDDPGLEGFLYVRQQVDVPVTRADVAGRPSMEAYLTHRRLRQEGKLLLVSGAPLSSEAETAFDLDGLHYASVASFYASLKLPEDDPQRRVIATSKVTYEVNRSLRRYRRSTFEYLGVRHEVGSLVHRQLIARATAAKVHSHDAVVRALLGSGEARLYMGYQQSQALGQVMPFVLMIERHRLRRS